MLHTRDRCDLLLELIRWDADLERDAADVAVSALGWERNELLEHLLAGEGLVIGEERVEDGSG